MKPQKKNTLKKTNKKDTAIDQSLKKVNQIKKKAFDKDTTFAELIEESPEFVKMLESKGLGCSGCPMAQFDTIEGGAFIHGMDPDELIRELNEKREQTTKPSTKKT